MEEILEKLTIDLAEIERELSMPDVASDQQRFKTLNKEHQRLSGIVEKYTEYKKVKNDIVQAREIISAGEDAEMEEMAKEELSGLEITIKQIEQELQMRLLPPDPNDGKDIILEIRAGTGGDEAGLFASDLFKMYMRFADAQNLKFELISSDSTGVGGYKEVCLSIRGPKAYELFIGEAGGHRVQRIPTTESGGRIHTSAATVAVLPEVEEAEVNLQDSDLRIDYYRSSGPGGQSVNTTDSAVRLTHVPTGIIVTCQDEKSQLKNRNKAMRIMRARIYEKEMQEKHALAAAEKKEMVGSGDRSQRIRTYNFPQNRVTDHRINFTSHNLETVVAGEMSELVTAIVKDRKQKMMEKQ